MGVRRSVRGDEAEGCAADALQAIGWRIVQRNLRVAGLEIDLLAHDELGRLVAVEVRARRSLGDAGPMQLLGARKLAALRRQREAVPGLARVDLLLVIGPPGKERLRLVRGIAERGTRWGEDGRIRQHLNRAPSALAGEYARGACRLATVAPRGRDGVPRWDNRNEEIYGRSINARTSRGRSPLWASDSALESEDGALHLRPAQWDPYP